MRNLLALFLVSVIYSPCSGADETQRLLTCTAKHDDQTYGIDIYLWPQEPNGHVIFQLTENHSYLVKAKGKFTSKKIQSISDPIEVTFNFSGTAPEHVRPFHIALGKGKDKSGTVKYKSQEIGKAPTKEVQDEITCKQLKIPQTAHFASLKAGAEEKIIGRMTAELSDIQKDPNYKTDHEKLFKAMRSFGVIPLENNKVEAKAVAELLLKKDSSAADHGLNVHYGNIILGRLALLDGNVNAATEHLKLAGQTKGYATINSFGPNMMLARELYRKGEKKAVLSYLDACLVFWKLEREQNSGLRIATWKSAIERGEEPKFGTDVFN